MHKILKEGEVLGYVITGCVIGAFWSYFVVNNTNIIKLISKIKGSKIKMKNIKMENKANKLVLEIDLTKNFGRSKSGKSIIIGTTEGNLSVPGVENIKIGVNCLIPLMTPEGRNRGKWGGLSLSRIKNKK